MRCEIKNKDAVSAVGLSQDLGMTKCTDRILKPGRPMVLHRSAGEFEVFGLALVILRSVDKLDDVVDYRATSRTIELLWVATGIAIHLYKEKKEIQLN